MTTRLLFLALGLLLLLRVGDLQLTHAQRLAEAGERNRLRHVPIQAPRGTIYDRHGLPLAYDEPSYAVGLLAPPGSPPQGAELRSLCELLGLDSETLLSRFATNRSYPYEPAVLKSGLDDAELTRIVEARHPGLVILSRPRRVYPQGGLLCHGLGYLDEARREEVDAGYRLGDLVGRQGLEARYDLLLRGRSGARIIEVDAGERLVGEVESRPAQPGDGLVLAIDAGLQRRAEAVLAETRYRRPWGWGEGRPWVEPEPGLRGTIALMDVRTGEILALAMRPGFDPNLIGYGGDPDYWRGLVDDPEKPLLARAFQSTNPPGSTFKLIDAAAGLDLGLVDADGRMPRSCGGVFHFGDRHFRCWGSIGHGALNLVQAIGWSCNIYFYQLGLMLGIENIERYGGLFGLNELTGIDLPHERAGLLPSLERLERRWGPRWPRGQILINAIGQGDVLVSPLGLMTAFAAIANGGRLLEPRLASVVLAPDGSPRSRLEPVLRRELGLGEMTRAVLIEGLRGVLRRFGPNPHDLCGKTGTAENPHGEPHAWFCGFAPSTDPEVAVVIMIENGGFGESYIRFAKELVAYALDNGLTRERPVVCLDPETLPRF